MEAFLYKENGQLYIDYKDGLQLSVRKTSSAGEPKDVLRVAEGLQEVEILKTIIEKMLLLLEAPTDDGVGVCPKYKNGQDGPWEEWLEMRDAVKKEWEMFL